MAGIDKTYTNSYREYREFKNWADAQYVTFFNGHKVCVGDWVWYREEEDFCVGEIPIMNSPSWLDVYLIQNCKIDFVLERMEGVYSKENYEEMKKVDLSAFPPSDFQRYRKIVIKRNKKTLFPIHNKPYLKGYKWNLQCNDRFWYHEDTKVWTQLGDYYPHDTNTAHIKSLKGVIRHLRKQHLPKGITFTVLGRYIGEIYTVFIQ
jgi:hypothetical protein